MLNNIDTSVRDDKRTIYYQNTYIKPLVRYLAQEGEFFTLPSLSGNAGRTLSRIEELLKKLQRYSVDILYTSKITGKPTSLEAKYDWHQPVNACLEMLSNTTTRPPVPGWMKTAEADCLAYSFIWLKNLLDTFLYDFKKLRNWFWEEEPKRSKAEWGYWEVPDSFNHTLSRLVPTQDISDNVYTKRFLITSTGIVYPVPVQANIKEFCISNGLSFEPLKTSPNGKTIDGIDIA